MKLADKIKELTEVFKEVNKLMIEIISFAGWVLILIKLFT